MGAGLAVLVILVFLRNLRSTLIVSLSIPISVVCAFVLLYFGGLSLNVFTLGGLALGVGRLVDDAIVVLENIFRHRNAGESPYDAAMKGSGEVGLAVLASTITTIIVFLPVAFITGIAKLLFTPLALTVAFSLIASYFVSLTVIPVLSAQVSASGSRRSLARHPPLGVDRLKWRFKGWFEQIDGGYQSVLSWALSHRKIVVLIVTVAFLGSLPLYLFIGTEFFPSMDESQFRFIVQLPVGTRLEESVQVAARMEKIVQETIGQGDQCHPGQFRPAHGHGLRHLVAEYRPPYGLDPRHAWSPPGSGTLSSDALMEKLRPKLLAGIPRGAHFLQLRGDRAHADLLRKRKPHRCGDPRI